MRPTTLLLLTTVLGLQACKSCAQFNPPSQDTDSDDTDDQPADTSEPDTADTGPEDTGPPPPCPFPETEDNDTYAQAEDLPLNVWACGVIGDDGDQDVFRFEVPDTGWYRVWARGAYFGSYADLQLVLADDEEDYTAIQSSSPSTTDAWITAYFPTDGRWFATISEQWATSGEDHRWELLVSEAKVPLEFDAEETEPNNAIADAVPMESGDRIYGVVSSGTDRDWYSFELPEGKTDLSIKIEAWNYGSPLDSLISLYDPAEVKVVTSDRGATSQDKDAVIEYSVTEAGTWAVVVKFDSGEASGGLFWYVIQVDWETSPLE